MPHRGRRAGGGAARGRAAVHRHQCRLGARRCPLRQQLIRESPEPGRPQRTNCCWSSAGSRCPRWRAGRSRAHRQLEGVVVAAGGDGTINAVAQQVLGSGCAFGVLPQGTFNYFGREHGIPEDTTAALQVLLAGHVAPVQVGLVNERVFLVNASLGLYPQLLEEREAFKARFGRSRGVAMLAGLRSLLHAHRPLQLRVAWCAADSDRAAAEVSLRTPTLFVGNNRLQLEQIGIAEAPALARGQLVGIVLKPVGGLAMLWLALRGAVGRLGEAERVSSGAFVRMTVRRGRGLGRHRIKVATDGEVAWMHPPLEFSAAPAALWLIQPAKLAVAPDARARTCPARGRRMTLLLQLSDTHFGTERPLVVDALVRLVQAQRPDVLVISGDITQRGTAAQYAAARHFVDRLGVPRVLAIPGNHDIPLFNLPARLLMPYARHRRHFGQDLEPYADLPDLLLLSVNTTRWWRHVDGTVSRRQVERVAAQLQRAGPHQVRVVVTHQPVSVHAASRRPQPAAWPPPGHPPLGRSRRRPGAGRAHPPALRAAAARAHAGLDAADVGCAGGHRGVEPRAARGGELGEPVQDRKRPRPHGRRWPQPEALPARALGFRHPGPGLLPRGPAWVCAGPAPRCTLNRAHACPCPDELLDPAEPVVDRHLGGPRRRLATGAFVALDPAQRRCCPPPWTPSPRVVGTHGGAGGRGVPGVPGAGSGLAGHPGARPGPLGCRAGAGRLVPLGAGLDAAPDAPGRPDHPVGPGRCGGPGLVVAP